MAHAMRARGGGFGERRVIACQLDVWRVGSKCSLVGDLLVVRRGYEL